MIPGIEISDPIGIESFFEASGQAGDTLQSDIQYTYMRYSGDGLDFEIKRGGRDSLNFQAISIPLDFRTHPYSPRYSNQFLQSQRDWRWRLFSYDTRSESFVECCKENERLTEFSPGNGYFLTVRDFSFLTPNFEKISTGAGNAVEANRKEPYTITLLPGYNLIGNPYNFDLYWPDVLKENGLDSPPSPRFQLKIFENGYKTADILPKFSGAFILSDSFPIIDLKIPVELNATIQRTGQK